MAIFHKAAKEKKERYEKREKLFAFIGGAVMLLFSVMIFVTVTVIVPASKYNKAVRYYNQGNNYEAMLIFKNLEMSDFGKYKDSEFYREQITDIVVPENITVLKDKLFEGCDKIKNVTLSSSLTKIGEKSFSGCKSLQKIEIPASVKYISKDAFKGCTSMSEIVIKGVPETIGDDAFAGCPISKATIPMSALNKIPLNKLTNITFNSGDSLEVDLLKDCTRLKEIVVSEDNTAYKTINGNLYSKDGNTFIQFTLGKTGDFTLPESVTTIKAFAFEYADGLYSITIGNNVTKIEEGAFKECNGLEEINFNGTVAEWNAIEFGDGWCADVLAESVTCSDGSVSLG